MNTFFIIKEGIISLKRARLSSVISIISIALALTLIGIFLIVGNNLKDVFNKFYKNIELEVFLDPALSKDQETKIQQALQDDPRVEKIQYISREQALKEFQELFKENLQNVLNENPLPPLFRVSVKASYTTPENVDKIAEKFKSITGVKEIIYQKELIQFLHKYFKLAVLLAGTLAVILLIIITILIYNTIRLTIHARKDIIQIMRLVGATNIFIKSPFIIEGIVQGIIGGGIAALIIWMLLRLVQNILFPQISVPVYLPLMTALLGFFFGLFGSYLSVNKYLKN